ncbi:hypothetical protein KY290_009543 [Solanum tuberosum]|uniref:Uncharacterized protein n=1 Tax=Solanum tuberosum TaxID=4113 RepID=A0ABQ7VV64_SOLTU|nr:hypothetical protein KY290_009543 [Solanum tuberosum]
MDLDDSGVMEARVQFVKSRIQPIIEDANKEIKHLELSIAILNGKMKLKSRIQPVIEDADNEIKHLELLIAIMNGKMKVLTAHRKVFQNLEHIVMTRGNFTPQGTYIIFIYI